MGKWYTINEGDHYASNKPLISITTSNIMRFNAIFDGRCLYNLNILSEDMYDINKLYGATDCFSSIHQNSYRFGWRHDGNSSIEIYAYWYRDGVRGSHLMGSTIPNYYDSFELGTIGNNYYFSFNGEEFLTERSKSCNGGIRFRAFPYFGGNKPAPNDMSIYIEEQ